LSLASGLVSYIVVRLLTFSELTLDEMQTLRRMSVLSDLLDVLSALVTIWLVGRLTSWQVERGRLAHERDARPPPAPAAVLFRPHPENRTLFFLTRSAQLEDPHPLLGKPNEDVSDVVYPVNARPFFFAFNRARILSSSPSRRKRLYLLR